MNCKELDVFTITTHTYKGTGAQLIQELRFNIDCRSVKYLHFASLLLFYRSFKTKVFQSLSFRLHTKGIDLQSH